jgi:hypothetical protein
VQLLDDFKEKMLEIERGSDGSHAHFRGGCGPDVKGSLRGDVEVNMAIGGTTALRQYGTVWNGVIVTNPHTKDRFTHSMPFPCHAVPLSV